jgi:rhodanese-related sulfurtransferase/DNA-binding transcriptional ArsR family regulator
MSSRNAKAIVLGGVAEVAKAFGNTHRVEILELLAQGEKSVEALARRAGLSVANASQHLRFMRSAGLLTSRREGKQVLYQVSDSSIIDTLVVLRRVAERNLAEVREALGGYFHERDSMEPVSREELAGRLRDGLVTLIDVRPEDEYEAGHLPGSISIPLRELTHRLRDIPKSLEIVAYCRGPYCVFAFEAVALLRDNGFKARRLEDGYPEWRAAGLRVEYGASGRTV